jgi:hypothetical protein
MTLVVNADQLTLASRSSIGLFPLVVLETFTDRDARTVDSSYYWSRGAPFFYKWDNVTAQHFDPLLITVSPLSRGFEHLPDQGSYTIREGCEIEIDATPRAGNYLWQTLLSERLIGARVTVASILIDLEGAADDPSWYDLAALGKVHTVRWRGEVTAMPEFSDNAQTFTLTCDTEDQILEGGRRVPVDIRIPPVEHGKAYPFLVGNVNNVKPIWFDAGFTVTTSAAFTTSSFVYVYANIADIPTPGSTGIRTGPGTFVLLNGSEIAQVGNVLDSGGGVVRLGLARGLFNTSATTGAIGSAVVLLPKELQFGVSGAGISGLGTSAFYRASGGGEIDLLASVPLACRAQNVYGKDPAGPVGCLVVNMMVLMREYSYALDSVLQLGGNPSDDLRVDVKGGFVISETATTLFDIPASYTQWGLYSSNSNDFISPPDNGPSSTWSATVITGGLRFEAVYRNNESRYTLYGLSVVDVGLCEIEVQFNVPAAHWNNFDAIEFFVNYTDNWIYPHGGYFTKRDLQQGSNTVRFLSNVVNINNFGFIVHWRDLPFPAVEDIEITSNPVYYSGTLISAGDHPADVLEYVLDNLLPSAAITKNAASFSQVKTDVPAVSVNIDISAVANTLAELVAAIGFNSRTNAVLSEGVSGTELKLLSANTSYNFGSVVRAIGTQFSELKMTLRDLIEIGSRFSAIYDPIVGMDLDRTQNYREALTADETTNDISTKVATAEITTAQTEYGARRADPIPFVLLTDATSATDVLGYYVTESLRGQVARYSCGIPFSVGYDIEAGDIVSIHPRWESAAVKCRVVQVVFSFDSAEVNIVLESVT